MSHARSAQAADHAAHWCPDPSGCDAHGGLSLDCAPDADCGVCKVRRQKREAARRRFTQLDLDFMAQEEARDA